ADPIESPEQLVTWVEDGVIAIGLTWAVKSRYAGGNATPGAGLTPLGRELVERMDELGVVHDLSHLSQKATDQLLEMSDGAVIASHSNCRALLDENDERHLSDETIRQIGKRGGIVGLNLVRQFIRTGLDRNDPTDRPSVEDAVRHVEHVCEIMGHRRGVALGSDMDGGITANDLPRGIDRPRDLVKLAEALRDRGWSDEEINGFAWKNWARFWGLS
ncbi:MAG: peptidase M19, partial [Planctomycetota bacterium]